MRRRIVIWALTRLLADPRTDITGTRRIFDIAHSEETERWRRDVWAVAAENAMRRKP